MTAPVSPSAPVAWRGQSDGIDECTVRPETRDDWVRYGRTITPLYASPAPSMVGLREDVLERLKCAAETNAGHWPIEDGRAGVTIRLEDLRECLALLAREGVGG
jgi:hypothetical protein